MWPTLLLLLPLLLLLLLPLPLLLLLLLPLPLLPLPLLLLPLLLLPSTGASSGSPRPRLGPVGQQAGTWAWPGRRRVPTSQRTGQGGTARAASQPPIGPPSIGSNVSTYRGVAPTGSANVPPLCARLL